MSRALPAAALTLLLLSGAASLAQDGESLRVELEPPARDVHVDDRLEVVVRVEVPDELLESGDELPFLLTPSAEGTAIDVVRGRLLRADADDPRARPLVLRVPLVARRTGTAVLRVRVTTFRCSEGRCLPVSGEASIPIRVMPAL